MLSATTAKIARTSFPPRLSSNPFLSHVERLEILERDVIQSLPNQTEDDVKSTRSKAGSLSKIAWHIEVACDAEIVRRAVVLPGGRGRRDVKSVGVLSTIAKRAKEVGVTPRTIEKNIQIFNLMQSLPPETTALANANLTEKHFYLAALSAADPESAVRDFAEKRVINPKFRVSDAYRMLEAEGSTKAAVTARVTEASRSPERRLLIDHIKQSIGKIQEEIIPSCPDAAFAERMYGELVIELSDHLKYLLDEDMADLLRGAWDEGYHTEEALREHTKLPRVDIARVMQTLFDEGEFILLPGIDSTWHKVGVPVPRADPRDWN